MTAPQRTTRVGDWVRLHARATPDRACFVTDERRYTFAEVNSRVNRIATDLVRRGVGKGDRVALFATDRVEYVEVVLACMKIGAWYVPLNYRLTRPELELLLRAADASVLFFSARYRDLVDGVDVPTVLCFDDDVPRILADGVDAEVDTVVQDDDVVALAFTSGTTGLPKGVLHSSKMVKFMAYQSVMDRRLHDPFFHYSPSPLFHVAGLCFVLAGISRGRPSLILPAFDPAAVLGWMQSGELTDVFLVPTMLDAILDQPGVRDVGYPGLRSIAYGAAPMSPELLRRAMDVFDCDFLNVFGAGTEAGLQTVLTPEDHRRALAGEEHLLGSIGKPACGVDLRLCDDDLKDVPVGEIGEIVTRSDAVMSGYLERPDATAEVLVDGWFRGGDLAHADEEGFLYLAGRRNDMIIRGGENIYPQEIEHVLLTVPGVREVAVVGVPDPHWGETVRAHVVLDDGAVFDETGTRSVLRGRLAGYKIPAAFSVDAELPRNAGGKVLKRVLRTLPS